VYEGTGHEEGGQLLLSLAWVWAWLSRLREVGMEWARWTSSGCWGEGAALWSGCGWM
jgi:hypothetical protein